MVKDVVKGVSVIVCCYNSAKRLPETIEHLAKQRMPDNCAWEVIIVDNASTDNTKEVARQEWLKYSSTASFNVVREEKPGLSAARHKGYETAKYEYLLYCDDDNWLKENYVKLAYEIMEERPEVAILGGCSIGAFESEPPLWFNNYALSYAVGKPYEYSGDVTFEAKKIWGAGSVIRKSALSYLHQNGFKQLLSDRIGNKIISGGDHELCIAFRLAGYRLYYDDRLSLVHFMTSSRLQWDWYIKFLRSASYTSLFFDPYYKAAQQPKGLKNYLKDTVFYELYLSFRSLLKIKPSIKFLLSVPTPGAKQRWFDTFYERNRILGLLSHLFIYRKLLKKVRYANWVKKGSSVNHVKSKEHYVSIKAE